MPCACQTPGPAYPENKEWGTFVWSILHALGEKVGKIVSPLFEADERRAWIGLLQITGIMLPCDVCRDHYKTWIQAHPVTSIQTIPYNQLKGWITKWLWDLHHDVNIRLARMIEPSYTELPALYGSVNIGMQFKLLELIEKRAIQQSGVPLINWLAWVKHYRTLMGVYGL